MKLAVIRISDTIRATHRLVDGVTCDWVVTIITARLRGWIDTWTVILLVERRARLSTTGKREKGIGDKRVIGAEELEEHKNQNCRKPSRHFSS